VFFYLKPNKVAHMDEPFRPVGAKILRGLKNDQFNEDDVIILKALIAGEPAPQVTIFLKLLKYCFNLNLFSKIIYQKDFLV
jgi:hypothetical protein